MGAYRKETRIGSLKSSFLRIAGWLIPLLVSGPSLFIWAGLMTMPLIVYLGIMFLSLFNPSIRVQSVDQPYLLVALDVMLLGGPYWSDKVVSILGVSLMLGSTVYLNIKRKQGLVTTGPYRLVRNPQYLGAILFIINMTSRSYREVLGDVGWIGPRGTLLVGLGALLAYIGLALIEDAHLSGIFGDDYAAYRSHTAFLIPGVRTGKQALDLVLSLAIPIALFWGLVHLNRILFP